MEFRNALNTKQSYFKMNCISVLVCFYIIIFPTDGWQMPSIQFLLDFSTIHNYKSVILYLPHDYEKSFTSSYNNFFKIISSSPYNKKISYVSQEMASNLTSVPILDEDLHVFIPNDSELENSLKVFFHLYSLRKRWIHEYWLLDISNLSSINNITSYLQKLQLDMDDNLFLYNYSSINLDKQFIEVSIWEFYEIHSSHPRKLKWYGNWNSINGLDVTNEEKWSRRKNFEGANLNIMVLNFAPYTSDVELKKGSKEHYDFEGWFKEIWLELKDSLNFSYTHTLPSDGAWGSMKSDGSWTGMIGALYRREIDLVPAAFTTTVGRSQAISFTMPLEWVKFSLFIKNPDGAINYKAYTEPLHYTTWFLIVIFCVVLPLFLLVSTHYGEKDPEYKEFTLVKCIIFVMGSLTVRGWSVTPTTNAARVAFAIIMIYGLLLNVSWNANLISYLSTSKTVLPFTSLETLIDSSDYRIAIIPNTAQEESFKDHELPIRQKAWEQRIEPYLEQYSSWYQESPFHKYPLEYSDSALFGTQTELGFHKEFITCKIINTNIPIQRATFAWGLQKHSPYLPVFNYHMKLMYEQGTIKKLYQKYKPPPQFCPDKGGRPINFDSCLTAFLSLSAGVIICLSLLLFEFVFQAKLLTHNITEVKPITSDDIELEQMKQIMEYTQILQENWEKFILHKIVKKNLQAKCRLFGEDLSDLMATLQTVGSIHGISNQKNVSERNF